MKIFIKAKPNAKIETVKKISETNFIVSVKEPPIKGKANRAIVRLLAEYFKIPPSNIKILAGTTAKQKILAVNTRK